jgi:septum site-determining protein MinC
MRRASIKTTTRCMSSSDKYRNYLEGWVGSKPATTATASVNSTGPKHLSAVNTAPLLLTGSSYLMPTLRLDRRDDPASLKIRLDHVLSSHLSGIQSMLRGKPSRTVGLQWSVPIVLDLSALVPDGSHHYTKPEPGLLKGVVNTLRDFGIIVVGVYNTPQELEREAIRHLGLPQFVSRGGGAASATVKVRLEDVIHMILMKREDSVDMDMECSVNDVEEFMDSQQTAETSTSEELDNVSIVASAVEMQSEEPVPESQLQLPHNSFVYYGSVRSGQQVAADKGQALVIIGSVNSGGEVLSDGDIYVFGKLRGRALAGLACVHDAKIITTSFDPELICIGDTFTTVDDVTQLGLNRPDVAAMVTLSSTGALTVKEITL